MTPGCVELIDLIISSCKKVYIFSLNEKPTKAIASSIKNVNTKNVENWEKKRKHSHLFGLYEINLEFPLSGKLNV